MRALVEKAKDKVLVIILDKNKEVSKNKIFNTKIIDWVKESFLGIKKIVVDFDKNLSLSQIVFPYLNKFEKILVTFSTLPLLTTQTLTKILEYSFLTKIPVCKLPKGYIIDSFEFKKLKSDEYFENTPKIFPVEEFLDAENEISEKNLFELLKQKILLKHKTNKVLILDTLNVYIDNTVKIGEGAVIYPFCCLMNNAKINKGQKVKPFTFMC